MSQPSFEITKTATFDAAHYLPNGTRDQYRRMHGHSFQVEASVRGGPDAEVGWVADLASLDEALKGVAAELDHGFLNEMPGLESPTLENLCVYFAERLKTTFPGLSRVVVARPTIGERCSYSL
jgi:6-pyruvoyltetrahydropterin/6-carboxytetrahydropterin synthase